MKEALEKYLEAIKADYRNWQAVRNEPVTEIEKQIREKMENSFNAGLTYEEGKVYIKVITSDGSSRSVHSFIVKADGPKFKAGDILKAAGWSAPAKNQARGNIFGQYQIRWTGPNYLR